MSTRHTEDPAHPELADEGFAEPDDDPPPEPTGPGAYTAPSGSWTPPAGTFPVADGHADREETPLDSPPEPGSDQ